MMRAETSVRINDLFAERRSPRSFDESAEISKDDLLAMLEAARWAPSGSNIQPWRFLIGQRGDEVFNNILQSLAPFNQGWAFRASTLILVVAQNQRPDGTPYMGFQYDCGLSVAQLTLEAHDRGYVAHQMGGFDKTKAAHAFGLTENLSPVIVIAIGKQGSIEQLDAAMIARESAPRVRKELSELVLQGLPD
ncbi:MAG: nitroreductase family protein [Actinobacteria bacterium]|nr:nitroreductase family protein [Actinomycetota bacterium]